jgi:hypothetical protein
MEPSMTRHLHLLIAIAATAALVACGDKPPAPGVSPPVSSATTPPAVSAAPSVPAPPATGVSRTETAQDSAATNPKDEMSKAEESKSMPMSGQAGSHSSTALDTKQAPK